VSEQRSRRKLEEQRSDTEILEKEGQRQLAFYKAKADKFYEQFRLDSALTYYQRALAFDEGDQEIISTIAAIENARRMQLEREQQLRESELNLQKTIEIYYALAASFYAKKYYAAAQDMLNLIFDIDPWHAEAIRLRDKIRSDVTSEISLNFEKAEAAEREGHYLEAMEVYDRILYFDPSNETAQAAKQRIARNLDVIQQLNAGIELFKAGRYSESRQRFGAVLAIDPSQPVAIEYVKRIAEALAKPPTLEDIQEDKVIWQLYLDGLRYMRNGEYQKAIEAWEKVLQVYPNNSNTHDNIEQARLRLKSKEGE
jgi:tetratricopeptide (TPR) repeat protein